MKKNLLLLMGLLLSATMYPQYAHVDYSALSADEARSLSVGTVLAATAGGNVTVAFDVTWKSVNVKTDGYGWFYAGETALNTDTIGAQGQTNGKDADGGNPANTLLPYASGAALAFEATADGYLTIFHRGSSNKQYIVFKDNQAIGYEYAQLVKVGDAPEVISYTVAGEGPLNTVSTRIALVQEIVPVTASGASIVSKNGEAAMRFPVYAGSRYLFGATGTKMSILGAYFSQNKEDIYVSESSGTNRLLLLSRDGNTVPTSGTCGDNLTWNFEDGTLTISGTGEMDASIPWYYSRNQIQTVVMENGITSVSQYAFSGCSVLTSITIPNSVTTIGEGAFQSCSGLTSVTIPNSVTSIGDYAFSGCSGLTSVTWNAISCNSPSSYDNRPFVNCNSITSFTFGDEVQSIPAYLCYNMTRLTSVTIPNSVTSIGGGTFSGVNNIAYDGSATGSPWGAKYVNAYIEGFLVYSDDSKTTLLCCSRAATGGITIPNSVTSIGDHAFYYCSGLTSVTIPNSVTFIGEEAFYGCSGLTSVFIDDLEAWCNIDFRSSYANPLYCAHDLYLHQAKVTDLVIPNSVTAIKDHAFSSCSGLTSVTIPNSVTFIGEEAFSGVNTIVYNGSATGSPWGAKTVIGHVEGFLMYSDDSKTTLVGCSQDATGEITIPNSVTSIGDNAFRNCSGLTSITIPNSVTSIGNGAFSYCWGLTSITIPNSVTSIGNWAFAYCSGLTSVTIPNSVTFIGDYAFSGVNTIVYNGSATGSPWGAKTVIGHVEGFLMYSDDSKTTLVGCRQDATGEIVIPNSVTFIGEEAFGGCSGLTSITIPNSVTSIGNWAFAYCSGLTSVTIPNSVTFIGDYAFFYCPGLTSVTIPNSVTSIGDQAFSLCSGLTSITIPNSVTSIGDHAFYYCSGLTSILVDPANTNYDSRDNCNAIIETATNTLVVGCQNSIIPNSVASIGEAAFAGCSGLTSVTIPNSVASIGFAAFGGCSGLTSVTIPNSVTSIGSSAFSNCSGLTSVTIPNSVTSIGDYAFSDCSGLTSVTIGNSVTSIGNSAFYNCSSVLSVYVSSTTPPSVGTDAFYGVPFSATLYYPCDASLSAFQTAFPSFEIFEPYCEPEDPVDPTDPDDITAEPESEVYGEAMVEMVALLTAIPNPGYQFVCWDDGDTSNPRIVPLDAEKRSYIATFSILTPTAVSGTTTPSASYTQTYDILGRPVTDDYHGVVVSGQGKALRR